MINFPIWIDVQTVMASVFMIPAMWRLWAMFRKANLTAGLVALALMLHGVAGAVMFTIISMIAWNMQPDLGLLGGLVVASTAVLAFIKSWLTWLGERHGRGWWFWLYVALSAVWAGAALTL